MRTVILAAAMTLPAALAQAQSSALPDPIAPAALGRLQCYQPDTQRKTCSSLAAYKRRPDGGIENTAVILVAREPTVTAEVSTPVAIKAGQVCGVMLREQIDAAKIVAPGRTLPPSQIEQVRQRMAATLAVFFGHEGCTAYEDVGLNLIAKETIDGTPLDMVVPVIWVRQDEGYEVRP